jgi:D-alanyl-lipoteichoic acid acyltransferase DltB (MBOAT superfamily)
MLFNSYEFLVFFLPLVFFLFWYGGHSLRWRLGFLTLASYSFYSWWQFSDWHDLLRSFRILSWEDACNSLWVWRFTIILLSSSSVDYWAAQWIARTPTEKIGRRKLLLALSITVNLSILGFFKYLGFFSQIVSDFHRFFGGGPLPIFAVILPLGISFYTFESMSYVIDVYRGVAKPARTYLNYTCFISFFPHLICGPIIRSSDLLHQFRDPNWLRPGPDWDQVHIGLILFSAGMAKKILLADKLAIYVNPLWSQLGAGQSLGLTGSWAAILGFSFRMYFDFSAYSDMATGIGHLFAVRLPQNFNSPLKAADIGDFWRRWHMTLTAWLRDYLFIPLGGMRKPVRNLVITLVLCGLWHGAAWLYIVWGLYHTLLIVAFRFLRSRGLVPSPDNPVGYWFNRQTTFVLIVIGMVFTRTADMQTCSGFESFLPAFGIWTQMAGLHGFGSVDAVPLQLWLLLAFSWIWGNFAPNSFEVAYNTPPLRRYALMAGALMAVCFLQLGQPVDFLYFQF